MSTILRRKIEASSGIAPSVLGHEAFWQQLQTALSDWIGQSTGADARFDRELRRAVSGSAVRDMLSQRTVFYLAASASPGLVAVALDAAAARAVGAFRLGQDAASLEGASEIFLRLLAETPALDLARRAAAALPGTLPLQPGVAFAEAREAAGHFLDTSRYLTTNFIGDLAGGRVQLSLIFALDFVQKNAHAHQVSSAKPPRSTPRGVDALKASVRATRVPLDAVIDRVTLSVGQISRLQCGQLIAISGFDPNKIALCTETVDGPLELGWGEMGVWKTQRALKLTQPLSAAVQHAVCTF
jgi:Type III flagellar switch regulator (C-ring) FliN C-term